MLALAPIGSACEVYLLQISVGEISLTVDQTASGRVIHKVILAEP